MREAFRLPFNNVTVHRIPLALCFVDIVFWAWLFLWNICCEGGRSLLAKEELLTPHSGKVVEMTWQKLTLWIKVRMQDAEGPERPLWEQWALWVRNRMRRSNYGW